MSDRSLRTSWSTPTSRSPSRVDLTVAGLFVLIAFYVRMSGLGPPSLWIDDTWVAATSRLPLADVPRASLLAPGFTLLEILISKGFGSNSLGFQLVPMAVGAVTPGVVVLVLRERAVALMPSLVAGSSLALSPISVQYSIAAQAVHHRCAPHGFGHLARLADSRCPQFSPSVVVARRRVACRALHLGVGLSGDHRRRRCPNDRARSSGWCSRRHASDRTACWCGDRSDTRPLHSRVHAASGGCGSGPILVFPVSGLCRPVRQAC